VQVVSFYRDELNQPIESSPYKIAFIYPLTWKSHDYNGTLAIYGFLVNYENLDKDIFSVFENEIFVSSKVIEHFNEDSYLKLKPLNINPVVVKQEEIKKELFKDIIPLNSKIYKEGHDLVKTGVKMIVTSNVTHQKFKEGKITARVDNDFKSRVVGRKEKAPDFKPDDFKPIEVWRETDDKPHFIGKLTDEHGIEIPKLEPLESEEYIIKLSTKKPISFDQTGSYISKALNPWTVEYKGDMIFSIKDLKLELTMSGSREFLVLRTFQQFLKV